jgi:F-type H+-transporting ATPase subunit epsilon
MAEQIRLEIVTPEKRVLDEKVDAVTLPGLGGEMQILAGHSALISQLKSGILSYSQGTSSSRLMVSGGFVEVNNDRVSVLADVAEMSDEIDTALARLELTEAEKALNAWTGTEEELEEAKNKLERAQARLQLTSGN